MVGMKDVKVTIVSSKLEPQVDAGVKRALMARISDELKSRRICEALPHGLHYIFKYKRLGRDGELETRFHVEIEVGDVSECYAVAKMSQLERFPELSHTGGESIGQVREMLKEVAGEDAANDFYSEYADDIPVVVIDDDTAVWLRDEHGIAPWHGGLRFPYELSVYSNEQDGESIQKGEADSVVSGFENDQEDIFFNLFMTRTVFGVFAKAWADSDVLLLDLGELNSYPVTSSALYLTNFNEVVRPSDAK